MLEVGTVHNYFRYYAAHSGSFRTGFLSQHTFVFDLTVTQARNTTRVKLTPTKVDLEESVLSLPSRDDGTEEPAVLVSSECVQNALPDVGAAWAHMKACNVLFLAPSGSGKDVVTEFFCNGLAPQLKGKVVSLSLAGLTSEECRLALFGPTGKAKGGVRGALPRAQKSGKNRQKKGQSGVVFVDEIHHPASAAARASLLRVMESREYEHPNDGSTDCKDLYFVFAASCIVDELRAIQPPDFWNRMDFIIEMRHPLDVERKKRKEVIKDYFDLFFSQEIENLVQRQLGNKRLGVVFTKHFHTEFRKYADLLSKVSEEFASHAVYLRPGLLSIRHLRALAHVMAANMVDFVFGRATSEVEDVETAIYKWIAADPGWRDVVFGRLGEIVSSR